MNLIRIDGSIVIKTCRGSPKGGQFVCRGVCLLGLSLKSPSQLQAEQLKGLTGVVLIKMVTLEALNQFPVFLIIVTFMDVTEDSSFL